MRHLVAGLLLAAGALAPAGVALAADRAAQAFEAGVAAFRAGDYRGALTAFHDAERRGLQNPNLDLNLGLAHFRLGQFQEARACFERVRGDLRYTAIADYHLGVMAAQLGDRETALYYLQSVQQVAQSPALRDQATVALRRLDDVPLEEEPSTADVDEPDGVYFLRAATGFDSNPELANDTLDRPAADDGAGYAELRGNLEHPLGTGGLGTTLFRADLAARQHDSEEGFDWQSGALGLRQAWRLGAWRLGAGGEGGAGWLDGQAYEGSATALLDGRRKLGASTLSLRYEGERLAGEGAYEYLDGWRHEAGVALARSLGTLRARAELEYELNERRDLAVGEEFSSYSPARAGVGVTLVTPPLRRLTTELRARWRDSRYADPNRFYQDGALREERRRDRLASAGLRFRLRAGETWNWLLDYQYSRNDSTLDAFGYARQVAALGIEWLR